VSYSTYLTGAGRWRKLVGIVCAAAFLLIAFVPVNALTAKADTLFQESRPAMGTDFEIYLYAPDRARAEALFETAFDEIERLEAALSNYRPSSELSRINRDAADKAVVTDPEVFAFLERSFAFSRLTDGAFDITVGKLVKAWGFFRHDGHFPSTEELERACAETGWRRVKMDPNSRSVRFLTPGLELDPGGIGKGYAVDRVVQLLRSAGVTAAMVGTGSSSIYGIGTPPGKAGWPIQVMDPKARTRTLATVFLRDQSLSTSGNYEKFFKLNGHTYCHIFDPRTGRPVEGVLQTTVIAPSATDSDALSTSVFVLGPERAVQLLNKLPNTSAFIVTDRAQKEQIKKIHWPGDVSKSVSSASGHIKPGVLIKNA
jgi:thiamine biosynthesis lipoprotein